MDQGKQRIVLDTNVLISALGWNGPERRIYRACLSGQLQLCLSTPLLAEILRVMNYPKFNFSVPDRLSMIDDLIRISYFPLVLPEIVAVVDDPSDNHGLACAVAAQACVIVTGDTHLLALGEFEGIAILRAPAVSLA